MAQTGSEGGVVEIVFPWETWDADDQQLNHPMAPSAGDDWYVNPAVITSDPGNFLPIWNWKTGDAFVPRPDGVWVFSDELVVGQPQLQAGDANMDLQFNQLDLVQVQIAAKYLTGQPATWGDGDWDGAPGGKQGEPPAGDGQFNQLDIIAALKQRPVPDRPLRRHQAGRCGGRPADVGGLQRHHRRGVCRRPGGQLI